MFICVILSAEEIQITLRRVDHLLQTYLHNDKN